MKKAFFISLSALLVIAIAVLLIELNTRHEAEESELSAQYTSNKVSADYARDTVRIYLPSLLRASGKAALNATTYMASPDIALYMTELMRDANHGGAAINRNLTLPSLINRTLAAIFTNLSIKTLDFNVVSVSQPDEFTIAFDTEVNLTILSGNVKWNESKIYTTEVDINSFKNPYNPDVALSIQREFWHVNSSNYCYIYMINNIYPCGSVDGISTIG
jgi:hypothetical protein